MTEEEIKRANAYVESLYPKSEVTIQEKLEAAYAAGYREGVKDKEHE